MTIKALLLDGIGSAVKYAVTDGLDLGAAALGPWFPVTPASGSWSASSAASGIWTPTTPAGGTWI